MNAPAANQSQATKVLFDASQLGLGHYLPSSRTGIFRVTQALARGLSQRSDCELSLQAPYSATRLNETADYVQSDAALRDRAIRVARLSRATYSVQRDLISRLTRPGSRVRAALRRVQSLTTNWVGASRVPIEQKDLDWADVYHSGFDYFPEEVIATPRIKKFITVYDGIHLDRIPKLPPETWAVCISEFTRGEVLSRSEIDPTNALVIPLAADASLFYRASVEAVQRVRDKYRVDGEYLLALNTLVPRKNMQHAVRCFLRVANDPGMRGMSFLLAGARGLDWAGTLRLAKDAGAASRVRLLGYVPDEDLAPLYSGAAAFVYPSLYEGFGLPVLEAMQCGAAVITSNCTSLPEVTGDAALLVNPTDPDELCAAMLRLARESRTRDELGRRGHVRAQTFTWDRACELVADAYRRAGVAHSAAQRSSTGFGNRAS